MELKLNFEKLQEEQLTIKQFIYLFLLYKGKTMEEYKDLIDDISDWDMRYLIQQEYIKVDGVTIKAKTLDLFEDKHDDFSFFVETYRNLFPKGVKSGNGTPIRGDKHGVAKKMEWFLRTYPEYSKNIILEATTQYVKEMSRKMPAYAYMSQADYFIQKDNLSKLAAYCEEYTNKVLPHIASGEQRL
jgi:hypothetical protein